MNYRGIEYTLTMTTIPGVWRWQFRIGDALKTGKTETRIDLLAVRRVQSRIDRELRKMAAAADLAGSQTRPLAGDIETGTRRGEREL